MKHLASIFLLLATTALGVEVGDTYEQVISEKGAPKTQVAAGTRRVLQYSDMSIVLKNGHVSTVRPTEASPDSSAPATQESQAEPTTLAGIKQRRDAAIAGVKTIVNQPPPSQPAEPGLPASVYRPGWFHDGAAKRDFNTVDVRQTQQFPYAAHAFVTSDVCVGTIFPGAQLEFNPMLKYFYTDRTQPKKRLTGPEMIEINRLYRIIGRCERQLAELAGKSSGE